MPLRRLWGALLLAHLAQVTLPQELDPLFLCSDNKCFSICWISKRFSRLSGACRAGHGHLMTVRSSEQTEAISTLLAKVPKADTKVWIGLQRKGGCAEHPLRGFTWVTGDRDTDYTNWKSHEQKCDAHCVTVRQDGTWEETSCDYKADGYLCEISYSFPCSPPVLPSSYNVTYYHPALGNPLGVPVVFPPGTNVNISIFSNVTQLFCEEKSDGTVAWSRKTPGAWSCLIENGGCEHECIELEGSSLVECKCPSGSDLKADLRSCSKPCDPSPCSQLCVPVSDPPGFICMCTEGYILGADGKTCEDIDDCAVNPTICEHHCTNTIGGFVCDCKPGFEMVETTCDSGDNCVSECMDIDECVNPTTGCEHKCENFPGGYRCYCDEGHVIDDENPQKCKRFCNTSSCKCDPDKCKCPHGYIIDQSDEGETICTDVDDCYDSPCDPLLCINTFGSYLCTCPEGYTMYNGVCMQPTEAPSSIPMDTPPTSRPEDLYSLQPTIMWGICSGLLSMFIVLIVMLCHRMRRHYVSQHDLEYTYKSTDRDVVLKKIMMEPQWQL